MKNINKKTNRKNRVRKKITENTTRPRLTIFRSSKHIYAQIIDDQKAKTLVTANESHITVQKTKKSGKSKSPKNKKAQQDTKIEKAKKVGEVLAEKAKKAKIKKVAFDRGPYKYHGRVKALAEAARKGGLLF